MWAVGSALRWLYRVVNGIEGEEAETKKSNGVKVE